MSELIYQSIHTGADIDKAVTNVGDLTTLTTENKTNLVGAINEHETQINSLDADLSNNKLIKYVTADDGLYVAGNSYNIGPKELPKGFSICCVDADVLGISGYSYTYFIVLSMNMWVDNGVPSIQIAINATNPTVRYVRTSTSATAWGNFTLLS